ncbi:TetR/AcrR family transcriptional regulator [Plesiomonas sp.]|uniref:TetR/AcrR family transcriptional regulator n=1 Tax=Plesiomonas sp. TaxID=2486279 RepID=UPI003F333D70
MRSAEFDRDTVLQLAMEVFRAHGYAKTTMQQLTAETGLHPGSIYAAFGNKRGLLLAAVEHYVAERSRFRRNLLSSYTPLDGIRTYLQYIVAETAHGTCLVTRTLLELGEQDTEVYSQLAAIYQHMEQDLAETLAQAQACGQLSADKDINTLTLYLLVGIQGVVTVAKCHTDHSSLLAVVDQIMLGLISS